MSFWSRSSKSKKAPTRPAQRSQSALWVGLGFDPIQHQQQVEARCAADQFEWRTIAFTHLHVGPSPGASGHGNKTSLRGCRWQQQLQLEGGCTGPRRMRSKAAAAKVPKRKFCASAACRPANRAPVVEKCERSVQRDFRRPGPRRPPCCCSWLVRGERPPLGLLAWPGAAGSSNLAALPGWAPPRCWAPDMVVWLGVPAAPDLVQLAAPCAPPQPGAGHPAGPPRAASSQPRSAPLDSPSPKAGRQGLAPDSPLRLPLAAAHGQQWPPLAPRAASRRAQRRRHHAARAPSALLATPGLLLVLSSRPRLLRPAASEAQPPGRAVPAPRVSGQQRP